MSDTKKRYQIWMLVPNHSEEVHKVNDYLGHRSVAPGGQVGQGVYEATSARKALSKYLKKFGRTCTPTRVDQEALAFFKVLERLDEDGYRFGKVKFYAFK